MMGRVGRADNGLNCAGRHGLTRYTASIAKITCNFCGNMIAAGSIALGCRCASYAFVPEITLAFRRGATDRFSAFSFSITERVPSF